MAAIKVVCPIPHVGNMIFDSHGKGPTYGGSCRVCKRHIQWYGENGRVKVVKK